MIASPVAVGGKDRNVQSNDCPTCGGAVNGGPSLCASCKVNDHNGTGNQATQVLRGRKKGLLVVGGIAALVVVSAILGTAGGQVVEPTTTTIGIFSMVLSDGSVITNPYMEELYATETLAIGNIGDFLDANTRFANEDLGSLEFAAYALQVRDEMLALTFRLAAIDPPTSYVEYHFLTLRGWETFAQGLLFISNGVRANDPQAFLAGWDMVDEGTAWLQEARNSFSTPPAAAGTTQTTVTTEPSPTTTFS